MLQFLDNLTDGDLVFYVIGVFVFLFVAALIRYICDSNGGYF